MAANPCLRSQRHSIAALLAAGLVCAIIAATLYFRSLGYPDGPIFKLVPARTMPATPVRGTVAVFLSGDMGFNTGMGPRIAAHLAGRGIGVIGVNSLTAFARRRTPAETTMLIEDAMRRALALPGAERVVLIGQSFGANALIAGAGALPPGLRARVPVVELVVPGDTMLFRATPGGLFPLPHDGTALPGARALNWLPVLCIQGETETDSLCPLWRQANVTRVALPGDHFLHEDTALVAATLFRAIVAAEHAGLPKIQAAQRSRQSGAS